MLMMVDDDRIDLQHGEVIKNWCASRALGCWPLTGAVEIPRANAAGGIEGCWTRGRAREDVGASGGVDGPKRQGYF